MIKSKRFRTNPNSSEGRRLWAITRNSSVVRGQLSEPLFGPGGGGGANLAPFHRATKWRTSQVDGQPDNLHLHSRALVIRPVGWCKLQLANQLTRVIVIGINTWTLGLRLWWPLFLWRVFCLITTTTGQIT